VRLFQAGRLQALILACRQAREAGFFLPLEARRLFARALARSFRVAEALEVLDEARGGGRENRLAPIERGELAYAAGVIHLEAHSFPAAARELERARACFAEADDAAGGIKVLTVLGNLACAQGRFTESRHAYLEAIARLEAAGDAETLAMVRNNLGLVEFKAGRFQQADRLLTRARTPERRGETPNPLVIAVSLVNQGKVMLATGNVRRAFRLLRTAYDVQTRFPGSGYPGETAALIAWTCELLGRQAAARPWWGLVPERAGGAIPPAAGATILRLRVMSALLEDRPDEARNRLAEGHPLLAAAVLPPDERASFLYLEGMVEVCTGSAGAGERFRQARELLAPGLHPCLAHQVTVMEALAVPGTVERKALARAFECLQADRFFDPLWFASADGLQALQLPQARSYLRFQLRKTPLDLLKVVADRVPRWRRILRRLRRFREDSSAFTLLRDGRPHPLPRQRYGPWQTERRTGWFRFDGPAGTLAFSGRKEFLRPGSNPHGVLSQLLLAFPSVLPASALYRSVWGGEFDPESDGAALKIALIRLRRLLQRLTPAIDLVWGRRLGTPGGIALRLRCPWEAVL